MEDRKKEIIQLVLAQEENNQVDFKRCYYADDKKYDLIKDVVSFANNIKNHNKYIIFGIRNSTKEVEGISETELPDISQINDLLHAYVEPFLDVEIGNFLYDGKTLGYLCIPHNDLNRPYVIVKDYARKGVVSLRKGEIYIRKGATNFIANRDDIDEIYEHKGELKIKLYSDSLSISTIRINNVVYLMGMVRCVIQNDTEKTIVIDKISSFIRSQNNLVEYPICFVDDQKNIMDKYPPELSMIPLHLSSGTCLQKTLYFKISETAARNLLHKIRPAGEGFVWIKAQDVSRRQYESIVESVKIHFSDELCKKMG